MKERFRHLSALVLTFFERNRYNMDLKTLLNQRNMTIEKLSEKSGVPQTTIDQICNDRNFIQYCSAETVQQLAKILECQMEDLMNLEPPVTYENKTDFSSDKHDLENGLPKYLQESIAQIKTNRKILECLETNYDALESDINCAQLHDEISYEQAWYLRKTYLGIEKPDGSDSSV